MVTRVVAGATAGATLAAPFSPYTRSGPAQVPGTVLDKRGFVLNPREQSSDCFLFVAGH